MNKARVTAKVTYEMVVEIDYDKTCVAELVENMSCKVNSKTDGAEVISLILDDYEIPLAEEMP